MHHVDRDTPWEEIWQAMEQRRRRGESRLRGEQQLRRLAHRPGQRGGARPAALHGASVRAEPVQPERTHDRARGASRLARHMAWGSFPGARWRVACWVACWRSRAKGGAPPSQAKERLDKHRTRIEAYEELCAGAGRAARPTIALAWLLAQPVVTAPIIGPRTKEQLDGAVRALSVQLSTDTMKRLDEIFPGPGGPAPEAYAW